MNGRKEQGTALLTVLLLTATLAALAIAMTDLMTRSLGRAAAGQSRDQAFWAMAGLEAAALRYLEQEGANLDQPTAPLFQEPLVLPFGGGTATITFRERSNCFNVNDLLESGGNDSELVADQAAIQRFAELIEVLGGTRVAGEQLAVRIIDFADTDEQPAAGSVDDFDYQRREVPYRSARGYLASVSELRAIAGYSRDVYQKLAPFLCALPSDQVQMLNVNTLTLDDAPILKAAMGEALTLSAARQIISQRPPVGYEEVKDFLDQPLLAGTDLPSDASTMLTTASELIEMEVVLQNETGRLRQVAHVWRRETAPVILERTVGERLP